MAKHKFKATEGLLEDVMTKQAGTVEKAILEAVMNSVDAGADNIEVTIAEDTLLITDDGKGMTQDEIDEYFEKFGLKDDDIEDKEFGKFRMGRGQIFNFGENIWHTNGNILVVNIQEPETEVDINGEVMTVDTEGLSYNLLETDLQQDGCSIVLKLYNPIEDVDEKVREVRNMVKYISYVHGVDVTINDKSVDEELDATHETELAWYKIGSDRFGSQTELYNKGAFVKSDSITKTPGVIITKRDLDLNFARNSILEGDEYWDAVKDEYIELTIEHVLNKDRLSMSEKRWLINRAAEDSSIFEDIKEVEMLETVTGKSVTLKEIIGESVGYAAADDKLAKEAMENGVGIILREQYRSAVDGFVDESNRLSYGEFVDRGMKFEMTEYDYSDLNKRRQKNFDRAEWLLRQVGFDGMIKPGYSQHKDVWKDDEGKLYVDKRYLKCGKEQFILERTLHILEVAAHDGDTRQQFNHDYSFRTNWWGYTEDIGTLLKDLLNNKAP